MLIASKTLFSQTQHSIQMPRRNGSPAHGIVDLVAMEISGDIVQVVEFPSFGISGI